MMTFERLSDEVLIWAHDKGIMDKSNPEKQTLKFFSEAGELADAIAVDNMFDTVDAFGDVLVTLIILAEMKGVDLTTCLESAYDVISKRKGEMVNGIFVKDE